MTGKIAGSPRRGASTIAELLCHLTNRTESYPREILTVYCMFRIQLEIQLDIEK